MGGDLRQARCFVQQLKLDMEPLLWHQAAQPVRPFDHGQSCPVEIFQQTELLEFRFLTQPVEIQMIKRQPSRIFVQEAEGWAGYVA